MRNRFKKLMMCAVVVGLGLMVSVLLWASGAKGPTSFNTLVNKPFQEPASQHTQSKSSIVLRPDAVTPCPGGTLAIDTTPSWNGGNAIAPFGYPNTATYGQTITAPASGASLESFTFYMNLPATCTFQGEVYAWSGTQATGPALWEGPPMATSGSGTFEAITFTPCGVTLTPNTQYVLFASVSKLSGSGLGSWGFVGSDVYSGGGFVYINNGSDPTQWTSSPWTMLSSDAAFQVVWTAGSAYNLSFQDDYGRSALCVNSTTGAWQYSVLKGNGAGNTYSGTGTVVNGSGYLRLTATPGSGYGLNLIYYTTAHRATATFTYRPDAVSSALYDANTLDDIAACGQTPPPVD